MRLLGFGLILAAVLSISSSSSDTLSVSAQGCSPRAAIQLAATASGDGRLLVMVTAGTGAIQTIRFTGTATMANATVVIGSQTNTVPFAYAPPVPTGQVQFTLVRLQSGIPSTIPLEVTDACGPWPTLVGAGVHTWDPAPTSTATVPAVAPIATLTETSAIPAGTPTATPTQAGAPTAT